MDNVSQKNNVFRLNVAQSFSRAVKDSSLLTDRDITSVNYMLGTNYVLYPFRARIRISPKDFSFRHVCLQLLLKSCQFFQNFNVIKYAGAH